MKVQTKILLLLFVLVAVFAGGLVWIKARERAKFRDIARERAEESQRAFDAAIARQDERLETFAKDSTYSDDMVRAVTNDDRLWLNQTIDETAWARSGAHAVWIYHTDRSLLFSANLLYADNLHDAPLPPAAFDTLEHQHYMHFFVRVPQGIMEMCAATIHPSNDSWRKTPPQGFFIAGQLWSTGDHGVIGDLARGSGNTVQLLKTASLRVPDADANDAADGIVTFTRPLDGWDSQPVASLLVRNESETVKALNRANEQRLALFVAFAFLLLLVLGGSVMRWVSRPLRLISQTLKTEKLGPIRKLRGDHSEFGNVAKLIQEFFGQRESLLTEIVERKHAQEALRQSGEQLRQSQKMEAVGRLAGGVAHDFNNLLTAILGYSELLAARRDLDESCRQHVETIQKAGRQAAAVTHQLLAFSRKQILQPRVIDLNALVADFEKILRRVIGEHIELCVLATADSGRVRADPNQIEQVILNLGVNARDAMMPAGGKLTIRTANVRFDEAAAARVAPDLAAGPSVLLEVSDTGHGMDDEVKSRIFEPFFTTKGPGKGTGLGLSTVYGVVKQSGGTIIVDSAPGAGCTFRVYLPQEQAELEDARPKTVVPIETPRRRAETVLVVEDEEIVRELVCTVLKDGGYDVLCASNGIEALQMSEAHQGQIKLMITDVVMPQLGGLDLARRLALLRPDTRVLYVSGYSENDMSEQGILASELEFLEKPFTPQALTRKVREVLQPQPVAAAVNRLDGARDGAGGLDGKAAPAIAKEG